MECGDFRRRFRFSHDVAGRRRLMVVGQIGGRLGHVLLLEGGGRRRCLPGTEHRGEGLGRALYERFFEEVRGQGRSVVRCVTSPGNAESVAFHEALGFEVERVVPDYDGPGEDRVLLVKRLS